MLDRMPLLARIMRVADVYDALISRRACKHGMPHAKAVDIIGEGLLNTRVTVASLHYRRCKSST